MCDSLTSVISATRNAQRATRNKQRNPFVLNPSFASAAGNISSHSRHRPGRSFFPSGCPSADFSSGPDGFSARKNEMGHAPRDFSASKNAAGCRPFAWGHAPKRSGCAPFRRSRARMIRGLPQAIFPPPQTVFAPPQTIGVRPGSFFGAQKSLGARLKLRKTGQLCQKPAF